jgi:transposase
VGNERLRLGLLKQHEHGRLLRFLDDPDIPPTNNTAERRLHTVVMARKVSQYNKSALGAQTHLRIRSAVETARLCGQDPVGVLISLRKSMSCKRWRLCKAAGKQRESVLEETK